MAKKKWKKKENKPDWFKLQGENLKTAMTMFQPVIKTGDATAKRLRSSYITIRLIVEHYGPGTHIQVGGQQMTAGDAITRIKESAKKKGVRLE